MSNPSSSGVPHPEDPSRTTTGHFAAGNLGKPIGTKTRITRVREAFLDAFEQMGGVEYLKQLAKNDPTNFAKLLVQLVPKSLSLVGDDESDPIRWVQESVRHPVDLSMYKLKRSGEEAP